MPIHKLNNIFIETNKYSNKNVLKMLNKIF